MHFTVSSVWAYHGDEVGTGEGCTVPFTVSSVWSYHGDEVGEGLWQSCESRTEIAGHNKQCWVYAIDCSSDELRHFNVISCTQYYMLT